MRVRWNGGEAGKYAVAAVMMLVVPVLRGQGLVGARGESSSVSSPELPEAPEMVVVVPRRQSPSKMKTEYQTNLRPFSHVAFGLIFGFAGVGLEAATPLSNKWNLRAGASFLSGSYPFSVSGSTTSASFGTTVQSGTIDVTLNPHFREVMMAADWFPFYGKLRISPGITLYNDNRASVLATVEGGVKLNLGDGTYTSDPNDPIRASLATRLGRTVAPRLTVGWGNMIPRRGERVSFPFEVGFEYVGRPQLTMTLAGSECDPDGQCYPITVDPSTQANITQEQKELNGDIAPLRFYPIVTSGVSFRF